MWFGMWCTDRVWVRGLGRGARSRMGCVVWDVVHGQGLGMGFGTWCMDWDGAHGPGWVAQSRNKHVVWAVVQGLGLGTYLGLWRTVRDGVRGLGCGAQPGYVVRAAVHGLGCSTQPRNGALHAPALRLSPAVPTELLELRAQSERDLQRLQHRPLLRLLLPAQGLGEAPPRLRADSAGAAGPRHRPHTAGGLGAARGGAPHGQQPQRDGLGGRIPRRHAGHPGPVGERVPLSRSPPNPAAAPAAARQKNQTALDAISSAT